MGFFESFKSGYEAVADVRDTMQEKSYLDKASQQGPAGALPNTDINTPDSQTANSDPNAIPLVDLTNGPAGAVIPASLKTPQSLSNIYNDAAQFALSDHKYSLAQKLIKKKNEFEKDDLVVQDAKLKVGQEQLTLLSQEASVASTPDDLNAAIDSTIKDPAMKLQLRGAVKAAPDFTTAKKLVEEAAMKVTERITAKREVEQEKRLLEEQKLKKEDLLFRQKREAREASGQASQQGIEKARLALAGGYEPSEIESMVKQFMPSEQETAAGTTGGTSPISVRQNNPLNLTDSSTGTIKTFKTYEEGKKAGMADLETKLNGTSKAYKERFGNEPVTPETLAETWSPAAAKGNSALSTANYAKEIAKAAGVEVGEKIPNTPEVRDKIFNAMAKFEAGSGSGAPVAKSEEKPESKATLDELYDKKRGGGLTPKEWSTISPTARNIGKEYQINPKALADAKPEDRKIALSAYQVTQDTEKTAKFIKDHPDAVGSLAALVKKVGGMSGNLQANLASNPAYTGDVAVLGKRLFTLGLADAAAGSGGRMNQFLEKSFANIYDQSLPEKTVLRVLKDRQDEAFDILSRTYDANRDNLNPKKYEFAFAPTVDDYVTGEGKKGNKPKPDINSFFKDSASVPQATPKASDNLLYTD